MRPSLPSAPSPLRPGPATPGGAEPFEPGFDEGPGQGQALAVFVADDGSSFAPADDDGSMVGLEYVAKD